jgi:hypothetical protein
MGKCECGCGRRVAYSGTYCAGHEPAGTSRDPHGKNKASNDKWNPINNPISNAKWNPINSAKWKKRESNAKSNPINNAKVQKRAEDEAVKRINEMSKNEKALTLAEAKQCVAVIMERVSGATQGVALEEYLDDWGPSFYWGYTSRSLADEDLRWLTTRGAAHADADGEYTINPGKRNRPVLLWPDDATITMGKARSELGFTSHEVYASTLKYNARMVENALQQRYQHLDLGHRLWRCVDKGSKYDKEVDGKLHKVFITYSPLISEMLADGKIKVNE